MSKSQFILLQYRCNRKQLTQLTQVKLILLTPNATYHNLRMYTVILVCGIFENTQWRKVNQMQKKRTALCRLVAWHSLTYKRWFWYACKRYSGEKFYKCSQCHYAFSFKGAFEKTQWRKIKKMLPLWFNILLRRQFEDTFEKRQSNATNVTLSPLTQAIWGPI